MRQREPMRSSLLLLVGLLAGLLVAAQAKGSSGSYRAGAFGGRSATGDGGGGGYAPRSSAFGGPRNQQQIIYFSYDASRSRRSSSSSSSEECTGRGLKYGDKSDEKTMDGIAELPAPVGHPTCVGSHALTAPPNTSDPELLSWEPDCCDAEFADHETCDDEEDRASEDGSLPLAVVCLLLTGLAICAGGACAAEKDCDAGSAFIVATIVVLGPILFLKFAAIGPFELADDVSCDGYFSTCDPSCEAMLGRTWSSDTISECYAACSRTSELPGVAYDRASMPVGGVVISGFPTFTFSSTDASYDPDGMWTPQAIAGAVRAQYTKDGDDGTLHLYWTSIGPNLSGWSNTSKWYLDTDTDPSSGFLAYTHGESILPAAGRWRTVSSGRWRTRTVIVLDDELLRTSGFRGWSDDGSRQFTQTVARTGNGATCPCAYECVQQADVCIDECASLPCQNEAVCSDGIDDYTCACASGYTGENCEININDCPGQTQPLCPPDGRVADGLWVASGSWNGDGVCDTAECAFDEADCCCNAAGDCCDEAGNNCPMGVDGCVRWSAGCINGGLCVDGVNHYSCTCMDGYTGFNCDVDVDECLSDPCDNSGSCSAPADSPNVYTCACEVGYAGTNCAGDIDECSSHPCANGAACIEAIGSYSCSCVPGFEGDNCATDIDECSSLPCSNGAPCIDGADEYSCACLHHFSGTHCTSVTPANSVSGTVSLPLDFDSTISSPAERQSFNDTFRADLAAALTISVSQVAVSQMLGGSILVDFVLLPADDGDLPISPQDLKLQMITATLVGTTPAALTEVMSHTDCAGAWAECSDSCESAANRVWLETSVQSGSGIACSASTDSCVSGDGSCVVADCAGSWSICTSACEDASERTFNQTVVPIGGGKPCPVAIDCDFGDGDCESQAGLFVIAAVGAAVVLLLLYGLYRGQRTCLFARARKQARSSPEPPGSIDTIFQWADADGDGQLSLEECNRLIQFQDQKAEPLSADEFDGALELSKGTPTGLTPALLWEVVYDWDAVTAARDATAITRGRWVAKYTGRRNKGKQGSKSDAERASIAGDITGDGADTSAARSGKPVPLVQKKKKKVRTPEDWLRAIKLPQYAGTFAAAGFTTLAKVCEMTEDDIDHTRLGITDSDHRQTLKTHLKILQARRVAAAAPRTSSTSNQERVSKHMPPHEDEPVLKLAMLGMVGRAAVRGRAGARQRIKARVAAQKRWQRARAVLVATRLNIALAASYAADANATDTAGEREWLAFDHGDPSEPEESDAAFAELEALLDFEVEKSSFFDRGSSPAKPSSGKGPFDEPVGARSDPAPDPAPVTGREGTRVPL